MSSVLELPLLDDDDALLFGDGWDGGSLLLPSDEALGYDAGEASSVAPWRCLDSEHAAPCSRCAAPPADGAERSVELRGSAPGKKDGEKRLRALLARTPEWLSGAARDAAADAHARQPSATRMVAALRARHSAELRKADLLALCRHWRYASDVWGRKSDGRVPPPRKRPAETVLATVAAPAPAPFQLAASMGSEAQAVAAVQSLVQSRLQALVAESVRFFGDTEHSAALAAQLHVATPDVMPAVVAALRKKKTLGILARDTMERLAQLATQRHAAVQAALLTQRPADLASAAWLALASRTGEHAIMEPLLQGLQTMAALAVSPADTFGVQTGGTMVVFTGSDPHIAAAGRAALEQVRSLCERVCAVPRFDVRARAQIAAMESILSQFKAGASYESYLQVCGILLSQLVGQTVANRGCMASHVDLLSAAERQLRSRVHLEELPVAVTVPHGAGGGALALAR